MKLRSESRAAPAHVTPIPFLLPDTQAMYIDSNSLLQSVKLTHVFTPVPLAMLRLLSSVFLRS